MSDVQSRLQSGLGDVYRIDRELGGGGMSRVFLAEEIELGRKVVIKVLPPEMGAGVNKERFQREIKLAASLQHPHVVPLLTAGEVGGDLLYYVMPFIDGESLRAKLAREGELPIGETVQILREVVDALAYSHRHDVVHRDIKPDNVLLSEGHAVVADFGVAKAVSASSGGAGSSLTSLGVALGTPAYMSPEQAAADPHVDHRADIYAVGALAYEMLTGRPPFVAQTPQQVLAAQVSQTPDPVTAHRETIPPALADVVMRCLAKRPADRWQSADDLKGHLDLMATPSGGGLPPVGTQPVTVVAAEAAVARNHPARVAAVLGGAAATTLVIAYALMIALGLPDWVFVGAIALLVLGLPIMVVTGKHERARAVAATTGLQVPTPTGMQRHFTWRKATLGGGLAFAGLTVVAGGYMAMRTLGIGPAATLMAAGVFEAQERLILANFENRTADTTLGQTVTELFRIDLAQSPALVVLEPSQLDQMLRHMERPPGTRLTPQLAKEVAEREGIKGYITGEIVAVGNSFALTGRLIGVATGEALVSHSERAANAEEIIDAVDRLSAKFRERIGESLRTVRQDPPLERVTTASMEALRLYAQGSYVGSATADYDRGIQLLEQAVELDTTFAMAYRKLAAWNGNAGNPEDADSAAARAYELRTRVGDRERWLIEAAYHNYVTNDDDAEENAYLSLLDKYPNDRTALNNQAQNYRSQGRRAEAAELLTRSVRNGGAPGISYAALVGDLGNLGELDELESILADFQRTYPSHPSIGQHLLSLAYHRGQLDSVEQMARRQRDSLAGGPPQFAAGPIRILSILAFLQGRLAEGTRYQRDGMSLQMEFLRDRLPEIAENFDVFMRINELESALWYQMDPPVTAERIERELATAQAALPDSMVPYSLFVGMFSRVGQSERATEMLAVAREQAEAGDDPPDPWRFKAQEATIALVAGDPVRAGRLYREYRDEAPFCNLPTCMLFEIGTAFDSAGVADSTIHYFERFLNEPAWFRLFTDARERPVVLRRLGELYEERGDRERAVEHYADFVELWENADPQLQPIVEDVRERIARLVGERR
ncbi:MAG: protein kinase [Gemmatimonadetes bacterium]|nr:protein kinase [Gemmatimonadota bacterium]